MSKRPAHERDEQILDLLDDNLPEEEQVELRAWLDASPEHRERFVQLSFIHQQIADQLSSQRSSDVVRLDALQAAPSLGEFPPNQVDHDALTKKKVVSALAYVVGHAFTPKRVAILATAAAVLLGVVLTIVLMGGPEPAQEVAEVPEPAGVDQPVVATLTGESNAQWAERALARGSQLRAGDRLTLTAGFAEITTNDGAIAILEAPATIELTDNDNALHLHTGKLVGICKTESSKGFTVFTDTAEVTDIGTVFGVERDVSGQTTAGVLSGHIVLKYKASNDEPRVLKTGDVAGVSAQGMAINTPSIDVIERFGALGKMHRPVKVAGDAIFMNSMPAKLPEDEQLVRVYREPAGVLLQEDLVVSRTETGLYRPTDPNERSTLAAGTRVDSFFVHINRPRRPTARVTKTFTLTFDQPVVALIVHTDLVIQTNGRLGNKDVRYPKSGGIGLVSKSGFEPDAPQVDSIQWSDDRKTLTVTLNVEDADQFRVLTLSPEAASAEGLID